jgi:hypothetical protein
VEKKENSGCAGNRCVSIRSLSVQAALKIGPIRSGAVVVVTNIPLTPVAAWSKAWVCGLSLAGIAGPKPTGCMVVCCGCVCLDRGLCVGVINRPEASCRVLCV